MNLLKKLWESEGGMMDSLEVKARIIKFEDEYNLEVISRNEKNFFQRLEIALKYIFKNANVIFSIIPLSQEDIKDLQDIEESEE